MRHITAVRQIAAPGSPLPDLVTQLGYDCSSPAICFNPSFRIDANGNRTDYSHNPVHGGLLSETGPAVGGIRPQTRHEYAQRYAWLSNGAGGYVQAATPVWVRTVTSTCRTSAATVHWHSAISGQDRNLQPLNIGLRLDLLPADLSALFRPDKLDMIDAQSQCNFV